MNTQEIADAYDAVVEAYLEARSPVLGLPYVDKLCEQLPDGGLVLDVGCGTGVPLARHIVGRGFGLHGIDISPRMIEAASQRVPTASFEIADILSWSSDQTYDGILAWDSLFHLKPQDHATALKVLHDALRPGGFALFSFGGKSGEIRSSMLGREFYYSSLSTQEYTDVLHDVGFDVISLDRNQPVEDHIVILAQREIRT